MKKSPPLILLVFILTISLVTPSYAGVNDNVLNSGLEQSIGTYDDPVTAKTVFGMLQRIVAMLTSISTQVADVQSMRTDIAEVKTAVSQIKIDVDQVKSDASVSAMQTYVTLLSDYQQNGTNSAAYTDPKTWDSLCRSATMINSLKFNGEALDYWISKGYDLYGYFNQIDSFPAQLFRGMTTATEVMNNEACLDAILANKTTCYSLANSQQLITASNSISETLKQKIRNSSTTATACASSRLLRWVRAASGVGTHNVNSFYVVTWRIGYNCWGSIVNGSGYRENGSTSANFNGYDSSYELTLYQVPNSNFIQIGSASYRIGTQSTYAADVWVEQYGIYF